MKRMTPAEAAEWRRKSVERYRAKRQQPLSHTTKPVTPQRARRQAEDAEYRRNRQRRLVQARGRCEFEWDGVRCQRAATQTHHIKRRRLGGGAVDHSVANLMSACLWCHQRAHLNVSAARSAGWLRTEWPKLGETPMER